MAPSLLFRNLRVIQGAMPFNLLGR